MPIGCTVNAFAGREFDLAGLLPAEVPRRVVVVGGGPAGMEAARVAGANTATMLWRITLPVLAPMILAVSVLSFIRGLQSFNTELLLGTPVGLYVYSTKIYDFLQREPRAIRVRCIRHREEDHEEAERHEAHVGNR